MKLSVANTRKYSNMKSTSEVNLPVERTIPQETVEAKGAKTRALYRIFGY